MWDRTRAVCRNVTFIYAKASTWLGHRPPDQRTTSTLITSTDGIREWGSHEIKIVQVGTDEQIMGFVDLVKPWAPPTRAPTPFLWWSSSMGRVGSGRVHDAHGSAKNMERTVMVVSEQNRILSRVATLPANHIPTIATTF